MSEAAKRVVIVGGGFGGLYAAKTLGSAAGVEVTLLDKRNFHLFQPLLYQVATGSLAPGNIASPLRRIVRRRKNIRVVQDEAVDLDTERRLVITLSEQFPYDFLIVATEERPDGLEGDMLARLVREVFASTLAVACSGVVSIRNEALARTYERVGFRWQQIFEDRLLGPSWLRLIERPK